MTLRSGNKLRNIGFLPFSWLCIYLYKCILIIIWDRYIPYFYYLFWVLARFKHYLRYGFGISFIVEFGNLWDYWFLVMVWLLWVPGQFRHLVLIRSGCSIFYDNCSRSIDSGTQFCCRWFRCPLIITHHFLFKLSIWTLVIIYYFLFELSGWPLVITHWYRFKLGTCMDSLIRI